MRSSGLLLVGKVGKPHGLRGEVNVRSYAESPSSFFPGRQVVLIKGGEVRTLTVAGAKAGAGSLLLRFQGLNDRTQAQYLNGFSIFFRAEDLKPLADGEYYRYHLIGSRVVDEDDRCLGRLEEIFTTAAHDVWVVRRGKEERLYPAVAEVILSVDQAEGVIRVRDIYEPSETPNL